MSAREPTTNSQLTILAPHQIRAFTTNTDKPYLDKIDLYQMRVNHYVETSVVKGKGEIGVDVGWPVPGRKPSIETPRRILLHTLQQSFLLFLLN